MTPHSPAPVLSSEQEQEASSVLLLLLPPHTAAVKFPERLSELRSVKFVFY